VTVFAARQLFFGLSSDTKPTQGMRVGAVFVEYDTGLEYIWDGSAWIELVNRVGGSGL
jgi:hypothetical protein